MKSHGHSPLGSIKDRVDAIGLEHLSVLPHIQYNGTDEPITFFDLTIGARSLGLKMGRENPVPTGTVYRLNRP